MSQLISSQAPRPRRAWTALSIPLPSLLAATGLAVAALLLAALPALADGGPHVMSVNNGTSSLTADSCAGCHRAHTAQGEFLLAAQNEEALCLSCHGNAGSGATTDVEWGIQYLPTGTNQRPTVTRDITDVAAGVISTSVGHGFVVGQSVVIAGLHPIAPGAYQIATVPSATTFTLVGQTPTSTSYSFPYPTATGSNSGAVLGALRNGGFVRAAIDSANPARRLVGDGLADSDDHWAKVGVRTDGTGSVSPAAVTSSHLNLAANGLTAPTVAWGNDDIGLGDKGAGPVVTLRCSTCHNPHGNGNFRILNPVPEPDGPGFVPVPTLIVPAPVNVKDSPVDNPDAAESDTKNYTVIQRRSTTGLTGYLLYADDVVDLGYGPTTGDYWHVRVPWNSSTSSSDAPNGIPANAAGGLVAFNSQMTSWCTACHTRYYEPDGDVPTGDLLYAYRHQTIGNRACTTCHVAHGSNARMEGPFSAALPFPNGDVLTYTINGVTGDSRLLKVDGRGTCQLCHDPTYTRYAVNPYTGPTPSPGVS